MTSIKVLSFPSLSSIDKKRSIPDEYRGYKHYEIGGKMYSQGEFYSLFDNDINIPKPKTSPPSKLCNHEWVVVGQGMYGDKWINCKKCDMAKEDYKEEVQTNKITDSRGDLPGFWD